MKRGEEQETIIRWDGQRETVHVFTGYPATRRKIEKKGWKPVKVSRMAGKEVGWFYRVPYRLLRWGIRPESPATPRSSGNNRGRFRKEDKP